MQAASQGRSYRHQGSSYALNKVMATDVVYLKVFYGTILLLLSGVQNQQPKGLTNANMYETPWILKDSMLIQNTVFTFSWV